MIDIGANLTDDIFTISCFDGVGSNEMCDIDFVILRAIKSNVTGLILTGGDLHSSRSAINLARKYNSMEAKEKHARILRASMPSHIAEVMVNRRSDFFLKATVGVHPCYAQQFESSDDIFQQLSDLLEKNEDIVVAVGECGLDYDRENFCVREIQQKHFPCHFKLAAQFNLPLFFHNRNTAGEFLQILKQHQNVPIRGVVHSYTGELSEMRDLLDAGLHIGVNGCSLKTEENCRVVADIPLDRLLLETDAPYCEIRPSYAGHVFLQCAYKDDLSADFRSYRNEMTALKKPRYSDALQSFGCSMNKGILHQDTEKVTHQKSPYIATSPFNITLKGRNEPSRISEVALAVYEIKKNSGGLNGMSFPDFVTFIQRNTRKLFAM